MDAHPIPCFGDSADLLQNAGLIQRDDLLTDDDAGEGETLILDEYMGGHGFLAQIAGDGQDSNGIGVRIVFIIADDYGGALALGDIGFLPRLWSGNISPEDVILFQRFSPPVHYSIHCGSRCL